MMWHPDLPESYRNQIVTGDARELSPRIPDESVDLIFTDPVYDRIEDYAWLAETAARVLVPGGNLVSFCANKTSGEVRNTFVELGFDFCDWLIYREMARRRKRWDKNIIGLYEIACWVSKGTERIGGYVNNFSYVANGYTKPIEHHEWAKEVGGIIGWIDRLTMRDSIVVDFFAGGGSTAVACKTLGLDYIAFEIDAETAERAHERVANTQPPLFIAEPRQMTMEISGAIP